MRKKTYLFIAIAVFISSSFTNDAQKYRANSNPKIGIKNGNIAPEIEITTINGEIIKLSSLRGKVVFIDFWASWCKGCRQVSKNLISIYKKYKDEQFINGDKFVIFSVCLDTDIEKWHDAVKKDSLQDFINVCDLKGFKSKAAIDYKIGGIPFGFLIDGNGIIIDNSGKLDATLRKIIIKEK